MNLQSKRGEFEEPLSRWKRKEYYIFWKRVCSPAIQHAKHMRYTGLSKKMDGIWNRYNLKSTGRIYTFCFLKYSEEFKVLDLP